ncbi:MAG TPA: hypothetical protein PLJ38_12360 [bacterium]|nr:hypothetical protein [bacterium]
MTTLKLNVKNKMESENALLERLAAYVETKPYCYVSDISAALPEWKYSAYCEPNYGNKNRIYESSVTPELLSALETLRDQNRIKFYCQRGEVKNEPKVKNDGFIRRWKNRRLFDISFVSAEFYQQHVKPKYPTQVLKDYEL